jgi:hypothetical protein
MTIASRPGRIVANTASHAAARRASRTRAFVVLLALVAGSVAAGCGQSTAHGRTHPQQSSTAVRRPASKVAASAQPAAARPRSVVARVDASSDRVLAEGKFHVAAGAPSNAEVRHEIEVERKAGIVLPSGESAASFENAPSSSGGAAVDAETPEAPWNPRLKPIASWIVPILEWAHQHGWGGSVTSGYRTYFEQVQLNEAGAYSAPAGVSNHETTGYPGGAVDVTSPSQLIAVLRAYRAPEKLVGGVLGAIDPEHFSATGD